MKILLATDGSECSEGAAGFLRNFSLTADDEVVVFHAVAKVPYPTASGVYYENITRMKEEVSSKILAAGAEVLSGLPVKVSTALKEDPPESSIEAAAKDAGADLIVLGARGAKGMRSLFLGSVSRSVTIGSSMPVLVTKPARYLIEGPMKLLFADDGSEASKETARVLASLPVSKDTEITILNVLWSEFADIPERFVMEIDARIKDDVAKARTGEYEKSEKLMAETKEILGKKFKNVHTMTKVGDPSTEIMEQAEKLKVNMIAVGSRGMKGMMVMGGSVSRYVLGHAQCPVLVGKAR